MSEVERKFVDIHAVRKQINPDYVPAAPDTAVVTEPSLKTEPEHARDLNKIRDIALGKKVGGQIIHSTEIQ